MIRGYEFVAPLSEIDREDGMFVGRKIAMIGQMNQAGFGWAKSFVITPLAYHEFIKQNGLDMQIKHILGTINVSSHDSVSQGAYAIQKVIKSSPFAKEITADIFSSFHRLGGIIRTPVVFLKCIFQNDGEFVISGPIIGEAQLIDAVRNAWAAQFDIKTLTHLLKEGKKMHFEPSILVQKVSDAKLNGKIFTIDTRSNDKLKMLITAQIGNSSTAIPVDTYKIEKRSEKIFAKEIVQQESFATAEGREKRVSVRNRRRQKASDTLIEKLANLGKNIEEYLYFPQEISWEYDGKSIYITGVLPITTLEEEKKAEELDRAKTPLFMKAYIAGEGAHAGIATGKVRVGRKYLDKAGKGDVLLLESFDTRDVAKIKKASALILEKRGAKFHPGVKSLGIPVLIALGASNRLRHDMVVTVNGKTGQVFKGGYFSQEIGSSQKILPTKTKVFTKLVTDSDLLYISDQYIDGVIVEGSHVLRKIGIHPKKLIRDGKEALLAKELQSYVENVAEVFYPRPVMYVPIDLKSNEYRNLVGGTMFELPESIPFLGLYGAYRSISDPSIFSIELEVIKRIREKKNLSTVNLQLPFVRSLWELKQLKKMVSAKGLKRGGSFSISMPVCVPVVAYNLDSYLSEGVDAVVINVSHLARLVLGIDPINSDMLPLYHEDDASLLSLYSQIIKISEKYKIQSFISEIDSNVFTPIIEAVCKENVGNVIVEGDKNTLARDIIYSIEGRS